MTTLGLPLAEGRHGDTAPHWACELGDVHFAIHPVADYEREPTATGAVKLAFMIFDITRLVQWLETRGVPLCYPPTEFGTQSRITAIRDPDGNLIELTELEYRKAVLRKPKIVRLARCHLGPAR